MLRYFKNVVGLSRAFWSLRNSSNTSEIVFLGFIACSLLSAFPFGLAMCLDRCFVDDNGCRSTQRAFSHSSTPDRHGAALTTAQVYGHVGDLRFGEMDDLAPAVGLHILVLTRQRANLLWLLDYQKIINERAVANVLEAD